MTHNRRQRFLFLVSVVIVCGLATAVLAAVQVVPALTGVHDQPYAESWEFAHGAGKSLTVESSSVMVRIETHPGDELRVSFEGTRSPDTDGTLPEITATQNGEGVLVKEVRKTLSGKLNLGVWNAGRLHGTLTLEVPEERLGAVSVQNYSGGVSASGLSARSITLSTSSGSITASNLRAEETLSALSYSGFQSLENLSATHGDLSASGGNISLTQGTFESLTAHAYSGSISLSEVGVQGTAALDVSGGRVTVQGLSAESATVDAYSGSVTFENSRVTDSLHIDTSGGSVTVVLDQMADVYLSTYSGSVRLTLPQDADFAYEVETYSGSILVGFDPVQGGGAEADSPRSKTRSASGTVGSGTHQVQISTSSGSVSIHQTESDRSSGGRF